jgi:putative oxidoreductase
MNSFLNRLSPMALGILRIVAGFLLVQHGLAKLLGWFGGQVVPTFSLFWFAGLLETIGGPLIILGLLTRPIAFVLAGEMLVAYWLVHRPTGGWPVRNGGMVPLLFSLIFLHLAAAGGGLMALDSARSGKSSIDNWFAKLAPLTLAILRVGAAFLFFQYGAGKTLAWFGGRRVRGISLLWVAGIMETIGAPSIALGLLTRPLAFLFSGEMAVAFWTSHFPRGPTIWPIQDGGEPAVLFCFIYLYMVTAGPGWFGLDGMLFKKSSGR